MPLELTPEQRFWSRVDVWPGLCWVWTGTVTGRYGQFRITRSQPVQVHRYAYELLVGPIPDGLVIDHLCRTRLCVNPDHLEPVSGAVNNRRGFSPSAVNARKIKCGAGHENWGRDHRGNRVCRTCQQRHSAEHEVRRKAARQRRAG